MIKICPQYDGRSHTETGDFVVRPDGQGGEYLEQVVRLKTGDELLADLRAERNTRLAASDPIALADRWASLSDADRDAWAAYRQDLRDIPGSYADDPLAVVWPVRPGQAPAGGV
jgi:hypothetical protein